MRKIFTLFAALVCGLALNAKTLYVNPGTGENNWAKDGAVLFVHSWGAEDSDAKLTTLSGEILSAEIPDGNNSLLFVRMPGGSTAIDWNTKWNQTNDLSIPDGKNMYTFTGWGGSDGEWSVYNGQGGNGDNPGGQGGNGDNPGGQGGQGNAGQYDYYLRGFFNGVDTQVPTAEEKFEGGILEDFTFTGNDGNGYFFVMRCDQGAVVGVDYMLEAYQSGGTNVTLKNKEQTGAAQKWGIPAGTVTFYLYDNGDGTLELSTQPMPGKTLVGGGQGVENTFVNEKAHKMIIDGQLRIIRGDKTFDATGRQL